MVLWESGGLKRCCLVRVLALGSKKKLKPISIFACHPCAGAMLIFSVLFQFERCPKTTFGIAISIYTHPSPFPPHRRRVDGPSSLTSQNNKLGEAERGGRSPPNAFTDGCRRLVPRSNVHTGRAAHVARVGCGRGARALRRCAGNHPGIHSRGVRRAPRNVARTSQACGRTHIIISGDDRGGLVVDHRGGIAIHAAVAGARFPMEPSRRSQLPGGHRRAECAGFMTDRRPQHTFSFAFERKRTW